jgi:hypothetical protein
MPLFCLVFPVEESFQSMPELPEGLLFHILTLPALTGSNLPVLALSRRSLLVLSCLLSLSYFVLSCLVLLSVENCLRLFREHCLGRRIVRCVSVEQGTHKRQGLFDDIVFDSGSEYTKVSTVRPCCLLFLQPVSTVLLLLPVSMGVCCLLLGLSRALVSPIGPLLPSSTVSLIAVLLSESTPHLLLVSYCLPLLLSL